MGAALGVGSLVGRDSQAGVGVAGPLFHPAAAGGEDEGVGVHPVEARAPVDDAIVDPELFVGPAEQVDAFAERHVIPGSLHRRLVRAGRVAQGRIGQQRAPCGDCGPLPGPIHGGGQTRFAQIRRCGVAMAAPVPDRDHHSDIHGGVDGFGNATLDPE